MNKTLLQSKDGHTDLTVDELHELKNKNLKTRGDLNHVEKMNVAQGVLWLQAKKPTAQEILSQDFIKQLHIKLFAQVWNWAGTYRKSDKNIGVDWILIPIELKKLIDNTLFRVCQNLGSIDEICLEFHFQLLRIHPFPNGNGRLSRVITDALLTSLGEKPFTWGEGKLDHYAQQTKVRQAYIKALRKAERGNFSELYCLVRK